MIETIKFLKRIYETNCEDGDWIFLSTKEVSGRKSWKDHPIQFYSDRISKDLKNFFNKYSPKMFDLYWSPMPYRKPRRLIENAIDTKYLAQDIDEAGYPEDLPVVPSIWWESSPNKYQGLWELDRYISEVEYTQINVALAKEIEADDCYDFPHVYRIPGSINHKYKNKPTVGDIDENGKIYRPNNLKKILKVGKEKQQSKPDKSISDIEERKIYAKYNIPQKVRDLLALDDLDGIDRSNTIWYIENKLYEIGMNPNEIILLVKNSVFNKYSGRKDEEKRLRAELDKIISGSITTEKEDSGRKLKVESYGNVMGSNKSFAGWLVKGFWGRRSHGIVAGMPKTMKSTTVHDLAISVASGKPFLGKFDVEEPGPVIIIQNENAEYIMRDRTEKVIHNRNLTGKVNKRTERRLHVEFPPDLPIHFINQQGFSISNEDDMKFLINLIKEVKPVLVVFDPLYLMFDGDINKADELNPILNKLLWIKNEFKTSVMVVHHYNKGNGTTIKGGQRMAGSIFLYSWIESAWYLSKELEEEESITGDTQEKKSGPATIQMGREFRFAGQYPDIDLHVSMGDIGDPKYGVEVTLAGDRKDKENELDPRSDILDLLETSPNPRSSKEIRELLGYNKSQVRDILNELNKDRLVGLKDGGYILLRR